MGVRGATGASQASRDVGGRGSSQGDAPCARARDEDAEARCGRARVRGQVRKRRLDEGSVPEGVERRQLRPRVSGSAATERGEARTGGQRRTI